MDFNARWLFDTYAEYIEPDELYTLAKTEYQAWVSSYRSKRSCLSTRDIGK